MIINWLLRTIVLTIILALLLHFQIKFPTFLTWIGHIPGDECVVDVGREISFPIISSAIISTLISIILPTKK